MAPAGPGPARTVPSAADPGVAISWPYDTGPLKGSEVLVPTPLPASQAGHSSDWASSKVAEIVTGRIATSRETKGECPCSETSLVVKACFSRRRLAPLESKSLGAAGEGKGACQKGRLLATTLNLRKTYMKALYGSSYGISTASTFQLGLK